MRLPLLALWILCGHGVIGGVPDRPHISQAPPIAPGDIGALKQQANRGDYEAQLRLAGVLRTDGKGKKKVEALQWLTIAATLAPADQQERIKGERDALGRDMKPKEVTSAQQRAAKWLDGFKASQPVQAAPPAPSSPSVFQVGNGVESPQLHTPGTARLHGGSKSEENRGRSGRDRRSYSPMAPSARSRWCARSTPRTASTRRRSRLPVNSDSFRGSCLACRLRSRSRSS